MTTAVIKERTERFAEESGIAGLPALKTPGIVRRSIWCVILLVCFGTCAWQVAEKICNYYNFDVTTDLQIMYDSDAQFPAVTFCNVNPVRQSFSYVFSNDSTFLAQLLGQSNSSNSGTSQNTTKFDTSYITKQRTYTKIYESKVLTQKGSGHLLNDTLLSCIYQGQPCDNSVTYYSWQHSLYGNCFTTVPNTTKTALPTPLNGLTMILYADSNEYISALAPAVGFQVEIHMQDLVPFPDVGGYTISPGYSVAIGIRKQLISRLSYPYGNCSTPDDALKAPDRNAYRFYASDLGQTSMDYSHRACWKTCMQSNLRRKCNCIEATEITYAIAAKMWPPSVSACDFDNSTQQTCYLEFKNSNMSHCTSECTQACSDVSFDQRVTSSLWPSDTYSDQMLSTWTAKQPKLAAMLVPAASGTSATSQSQPKPVSDVTTRTFINRQLVRANLAQLVVYFQELNYVSITESPAMDLSDLASDIGGILGLWIGMCIVSVASIVEWLLDLIILASRRKSKKEVVQLTTQDGKATTSHRNTGGIIY